jgi:hypothetical protein
MLVSSTISIFEKRAFDIMSYCYAEAVKSHEQDDSVEAIVQGSARHGFRSMNILTREALASTWTEFYKGLPSI